MKTLRQKIQEEIDKNQNKVDAADTPVRLLTFYRTKAQAFRKALKIIEETIG